VYRPFVSRCSYAFTDYDMVVGRNATAFGDAALAAMEVKLSCFVFWVERAFFALIFLAKTTVSLLPNLKRPVCGGQSRRTHRGIRSRAGQRAVTCVVTRAFK
jgi:hypothetical protein